MDFGTALGYGVGAAAGGLATSKYAEIESQITQDRTAALAQIKSNIDIAQQETLRQNKVSQINAAADQSAQQRAGAVRQGLINSDMAPGNTEPVSADPNDLIAADHGDTSQLTNSDLSVNAQNTLNAASQPNDSDIVRGSVKAGYTDPIELVKMNQADRIALAQQRLANLKEQHEQDWKEIQDKKEMTRDRQVDAMFAKIGASLGGDGKAPEIALANWMVKNGKFDDPVQAMDAVMAYKGEGKTKDPLALQAQLAAAYVNTLHTSDIPKDGDGKATMTMPQFAWQVAGEQISSAKGTKSGSAPAAPTAPAAPSRPPLSSFSK